MAAAVKAKGPIELPELKRGIFKAYIIGESPLIVHAWNMKALRQMLAKQMGQALPKYPKSPVQDFLDSLYHTDDGAYAFPATGVKKSMITSCTSMNKEITKIAAMQSFAIKSEQGFSQSAFAGLQTPMQLIRVYSPEAPHIREDAVKLKGGTADLRYRAEMWPWGMIFDIEYNKTVVTAATIAALIDTAGFAVGLGEWRQERMGINGTFRLADAREQKMIEKWSAQPRKEPVLPDEKQFLAELHEAVKRYGELVEEEDVTAVAPELAAQASAAKPKGNGKVTRQ